MTQQTSAKLTQKQLLQTAQHWGCENRLIHQEAAHLITSATCLSANLHTTHVFTEAHTKLI